VRKRSGTLRRVCKNDIFRRLSGLLFLYPEIIICSPPEKMGAIFVFEKV
jgi:hypothetical protein